MNEAMVGIRDLKANLSRHLQTVKQGGLLVITEHGKPIGRILPFVGDAHSRTQELIDAGLAAWSGEKAVATESGPIIPGRQTLADLLLEDRE